jgi:glycosyltransferase involved in cell wall biosynthesis
MKPAPSLSVVVTTYNKPRDLERVLEGFRHQTLTDFELLVCDDGSGPETRALVEAFQGSAPFPVEHCWQEDAGFRAARSRNNGGRAARGQVLVFCDGDCVPSPDFLSRHADAQTQRTFLAGERWLLEEGEAAQVNLANIASGEAFSAVPARERKRVRRVARNNALYRWTGLKPDRPHLMTCNCSVPLAAFQEVNGLDERYEGWGQEDEDLRRRLVRRGWRAGSVIDRANAIHLWHPADPTFLGKRKMSPNWRYYERGFYLSRCRRGLVERPLEDLSWRVASSNLELAAAALGGMGVEEAPEGAQVEVELRLGSRVKACPDEAELTVKVTAAAPTPEAARGAHLLLYPGAPIQGGELPTQSLDPVDPALWAVGVRAQRPVPGGGGPDGLGPETWAEARRLLDELL